MRRTTLFSVLSSTPPPNPARTDSTPLTPSASDGTNPPVMRTSRSSATSGQRMDNENDTPNSSPPRLVSIPGRRVLPPSGSAASTNFLSQTQSEQLLLLTESFGRTFSCLSSHMSAMKELCEALGSPEVVGLLSTSPTVCSECAHISLRTVDMAVDIAARLKVMSARLMEISQEQR